MNGALRNGKIKRIQQLYPSSQIITVTDGNYDADYEAFCKHYSQVSYSQGDRLKLMQFGGRWTERMLSLFLAIAQPNSTLIKIDPGDSRLNFPLPSVPDAHLFGNLREAGGRMHVQGGCIGLSVAGATLILASQLLGSPQFCTHRYSYPPTSHPYNKKRPRAQTNDETLANKILNPSLASFPEWLTVEDVILYEVAETLKLEIANFGEVYCHYLACPSRGEVSLCYNSPGLS